MAPEAPCPRRLPKPEILAPRLPIAAIELRSNDGIKKNGTAVSSIATRARIKLVSPLEPILLRISVDANLPPPISNPHIG